MLIKMFSKKVHVPFNCSMWILKMRVTTHVKPQMVLAWPSPTLSIWKSWPNPDSLPSPKSKLQQKAKRLAIFIQLLFNLYLILYLICICFIVNRSALSVKPMDILPLKSNGFTMANLSHKHPIIPIG